MLLQANEAIAHELVTNRAIDYRKTDDLNVIAVPSRTDAYRLMRRYDPIIGSWPGRTYIRYENREIEVEKRAMSDIIQVDGLALTLPVITMIRSIYDNQRSCGVVRLLDDWQCIVFDGKKHNNEDGKFLIGHSIDTATTWKRHQYYAPEDYERMQQFLRDEMRTDSDTWQEFRYKVRDPESNSDTLTHELVTDFRLVSDGLGNHYHWGQNRIIEPIAA